MVEHVAPAPVFAYRAPAPEVQLPAPAPDLRDQRVRHVRGDPGCSVSFRFETHDGHHVMVNNELRDTPEKHPVLFTKAPSNSKVYRERLSADRVRDA